MARGLVAVLAAATLCACATSGGAGGMGSAPQKTTTSVSVPVAAGGDQGTANMEFSTWTSGAPLVTRLSAPREAVFAAAESAYVALGIPVGMRDPANWQVGNRNYQVSRRLNGQPLSHYFNCGNSGMGAELSDTHRLQVAVLSTVVQDGSGTRLETSASAIARQMGTSSPPVNCASTGVIEQEIAERVTRAVGG